MPLLAAVGCLAVLATDCHSCPLLVSAGHWHSGHCCLKLLLTNLVVSIPSDFSCREPGVPMSDRGECPASRHHDAPTREPTERSTKGDAVGSLHWEASTPRHATRCGYLKLSFRSVVPARPGNKMARASKHPTTRLSQCGAREARQEEWRFPWQQPFVCAVLVACAFHANRATRAYVMQAKPA